MMNPVWRALSGAGSLVLVLETPALAHIVEPGDASQFVGEYAIAFPDRPGVIVNTADATCERPAVITQRGPSTIHVRTPGGDMGDWSVQSFGDRRHPWWKEQDGQLISTLVAEWIEGEDAFLLVQPNPTNGRVDWDFAKQWTRCPPIDETH